MLNKNKLIILILIIAALLRFIGTNPGYNQYHADEGISYSAATSMIKNGNLDPLRYDYPALVPLINYVIFRGIFIPTSWTLYFAKNIPEIIDGVVHIPLSKLEAKRIFQVQILGERERNALFWGRYVTALFSLGNVLLVYLLASKLFNKNVGLISAFLLTFNYKHVVNSHIGLPDVYNAFFVLLVLLFCFRLWKEPKPKNYLLTGIAVGLSLSVKYQFFSVFPFFLTHLFVSLREKKFVIKRFFSPAFVMGVFCIGIVFLLMNPYHFLYLDKTIEIVRGVSKKYGMGSKQLNLYPFWYFFNIDYGAIEFCAIFLGLAICLKTYFKKSLLILSHAIPFMFVMIYYSGGGFYIRNFITVTPIFLIFAAVFLWYVYKFLKRKFGQKISFLALPFLLFANVFVPGKNAIINSYSYTKAWGYDLMRPWVEKNIPKDVIVATHPFDGVNLGVRNKKTEFEISGAWSLNEHKENNASYLLLDLNWVGSPFYFWMSFGFDDIDLFWKKPLDIMRNTYHGVATEELFRYQVHAVTKPWQAPDTHILAIKFFDWKDVPNKNVADFDFSNSNQDWKVYGQYEDETSPFAYDKEVGNKSKGSLVFLPSGARFSSVRITSSPIEVKEGHLYQVEGFLKTDINLDTREREGFIRVDFYENKDNLDKVGKNATVSSRVFGTTDWVKKTLNEIAPKGARYMTVSFQTYITTKTKIWLDDVVIKESVDKIEDPRESSPYIKNDIDSNYVYPNSHGNL